MKMGPIRCHETSVNNYYTTPSNIPEERRSHQHRGGSLKSVSTVSFRNLFLSHKYLPSCIREACIKAYRSSGQVFVIFAKFFSRNRNVLTNLIKLANFKCHENPFSDSRAVTDGQTGTQDGANRHIF